MNDTTCPLCGEAKLIEYGMEIEQGVGGSVGVVQEAHCKSCAVTLRRTTRQVSFGEWHQQVWAPVAKHEPVAEVAQ